MSALLIKQWKWVGVALVIVILAVLSRSGDVRLGRLSQSDRCQVEVNVDVLNVRAGPGADTPLVDKLNRGAIVDAMSDTANGFRKLGDNRWVSGQFVTPNSHC